MKIPKSTYALFLGVILIIGISVLLLMLSAYDVSLKPFGISTKYVAELYGELDLNNSCVTVMDENETRYTLVWPVHYQVIIENDRLTIFDHYLDMNVTWQFGERIRIRGEEVSEVDQEDTQAVDPRCPGPFWIVSGWE